jgi:SulP family sulfate permease
VEYALLLATFALVMAGGLEAGIAGGIVLAALHFAYRWGPGLTPPMHVY